MSTPVAISLALVRAAASTRPLLLSARGITAVWLPLFVLDWLFASSIGAVAQFVVYPLGVVLWLFNRSNAVWVERDRNGVRILTRRWWKYEDLWSGKLRATGKPLQQFPPAIDIRFDAEPSAWWRSDCALCIGETRLSVYPENPGLERRSTLERWQPPNRLLVGRLENVIDHRSRPRHGPRQRSQVGVPLMYASAERREIPG